MGNSVSEKSLEYCSETSIEGRIIYSSYSLHGMRPSMEDAFKNKVLSHENEFFVCGIFDGHGGHEVSFKLRDNLLELLSRNLYYRSFVEGKCVNLDLLYTAVEETFYEFDRNLCNSETGSTAILCFITKTKIICANVGDCRALLVFKDGTFIQISNDHKADFDINRIVSAGGFVTNHTGVWRVNGCLAISRAFGDVSFKTGSDKDNKKIVTVEPDFQTFERTDQTCAIIMASDGVWDEISNNEMVEEYMFFSECFNNGMHKHHEYISVNEVDELKKRNVEVLGIPKIERTLVECYSKDINNRNVEEAFAKYICMHALSKNSTDNCTATVIKL